MDEVTGNCKTSVQGDDGWTVRLSSFRAVLLDIQDQGMTIKELRRLLLAHRETGKGIIGAPPDIAHYINGLERNT